MFSSLCDFIDEGRNGEDSGPTGQRWPAIRGKVINKNAHYTKCWYICRGLLVYLFIIYFTTLCQSIERWIMGWPVSDELHRIYNSCINQQMHTYEVVQLYMFSSSHVHVLVTPVTIYRVFHSVNIGEQEKSHKLHNKILKYSVYCKSSIQYLKTLLSNLVKYYKIWLIFGWGRPFVLVGRTQ